MPEVTVVTDTTACIPPEKVKQYAIEVVPIELVFGKKSYRDGIDLTPAEFYNMLRTTHSLPTTAGSLPGPYLKTFRSTGRKTKHIFCVTEPAAFSGMYNAALVARETVQAELPETTITVLEGSTAAAGLGLAVLEGARAAAAGKSLDEVKEATLRVMGRVQLYAALDTLKYLAKSGRVPQAAALFNSWLQVKPIFKIIGGKAHTVALPRTMEGAVRRILKIMSLQVSADRPLHAAVMHAASPEEAARLKELIAGSFDCTELFITEFTPVMGVHTGPGLLGITFYDEEVPGNSHTSGETGKNGL